MEPSAAKSIRSNQQTTQPGREKFSNDEDAVWLELGLEIPDRLLR